MISADADFLILPLLIRLRSARFILPMQLMRSRGIFCTKYSRCSLAIVHIGRFFWFVSSSRSFRSCNRFGNQTSSHEQISGLSTIGHTIINYIYDNLHNMLNCVPIISIPRSVSRTGSITSSGIRVNLLFCSLSVSNEFRFSKTMGGKTCMLMNG